MFAEKEVKISEVKSLLHQGYEVEVDSPDGWVGVSNFVDKGLWEEYVFASDSGKVVRCNENHLFKTVGGEWKSANDLYKLKDGASLVTNTGVEHFAISRTYEKVPIVDITVDHDNHRYYTNGVESHNTGVGKSLFMCHMAANCMNQGKNVLYITLEMAEERIAERIDANLMNVSMEDLHDLPKTMYDSKINKIIKETNGQLVIKEYPTASAHSAHFRGLIKELAIKKSFKPDIIFIDYLNICASSRFKGQANVNSYMYIKSIAEELRGLAVETNVPIMSATQTNRSGFSNSDVGLEDTSESFGLPATADLMFALISNEELDALNQIAVKQLKNRYNDVNVNKRFVIGIDRGKMRLMDLDESEQKGLSDSNQTEEVDDFETPTFDNTNFGEGWQV